MPFRRRGAAELIGRTGCGRRSFASGANMDVRLFLFSCLWRLRAARAAGAMRLVSSSRRSIPGRRPSTGQGATGRSRRDDPERPDGRRRRPDAVSCRRRSNDFRRAHGAAPLAVARQLTRAADAHAPRVASLRRHVQHSGRTAGPSTSGFVRTTSLPATGTGQSARTCSGARGRRGRCRPRRQLALWVAGPPHLAILLTPGWKQVGIGAVAAPDAGGVYDGASVLIVAADFGAR
jgi:uncharacterized protein YkwD